MWKVLLSNGQVKSEEEFKNERQSAWKEFLDFVFTNKVKVTRLFFVLNGKEYSLPGVGEPKFSEFSVKKPLGYRFFRKIGKDIGSKFERYAVLEASYDGYISQLWIDEESGNCYSLVLK